LELFELVHLLSQLGQLVIIGLHLVIVVLAHVLWNFLFIVGNGHLLGNTGLEVLQLLHTLTDTISLGLEIDETNDLHEDGDLFGDEALQATSWNSIGVRDDHGLTGLGERVNHSNLLFEDSQSLGIVSLHNDGWLHVTLDLVAGNLGTEGLNSVHELSHLRIVLGEVKLFHLLVLWELGDADRVKSERIGVRKSLVELFSKVRHRWVQQLKTSVQAKVEAV